MAWVENLGPNPPGQDIRYENEIRLLQSLNRTEHLPADAVVFTGSSIFRFWSTLARDMAPLPVLNRSFGGAQVSRTFYARGQTGQQLLLGA